MTAPTGHDPPPQPGRRKFLVELAALVAGAVAALVPAAAGLTFFLHPLRRRAANGRFVKIASARALTADGMPRKFPVITGRVDAWNRYPAVPIGAVYLRRTADNQVKAFNVVCPHAGCFVDFVAERGGYVCPCHDSTFDLEGRIRNPNSPSPRGLDELEVEIRKDDQGNEGEVWVKFQNFQAGTKDKIPQA